MDIEYTVWKLW